MNLYDVVVRVGGSLHNEVERHGITAAEVIMLQSMHGDDAVRNIKHVGETDESHTAIRERLVDFYGTGRVETGRSGEVLVKDCFGPKSMPLPTTVEGIPNMLISPAPSKNKIPTSLTSQ